jgi:hypothetical protein
LTGRLIYGDMRPPRQHNEQGVGFAPLLDDRLAFLEALALTTGANQSELCVGKLRKQRYTPQQPRVKPGLPFT